MKAKAPKKPARKPKPTLAAWWSEFESKTIHRDAGPAQRREMRNAFYAGAACLMQLTVEIGEPDVSEQEGMAILSGVRDELTAFTRALRAEMEGA
jgi:hypothetical protein